MGDSLVPNGLSSIQVTLTPAAAKQKLKSSARDVSKGTTAHGETAVAGPDLATGSGLADANWAYLNTMGEVATNFFSAPRDQQLAMISGGTMPEISREFVDDLIETLRARESARAHDG